MVSSKESAGSSHHTARYMQTIEAVEEMRVVLRKEHSLTIQFMMTVWRRVFTTFQAAQVNVQVRASVIA